MPSFALGAASALAPTPTGRAPSRRVARAASTRAPVRVRASSEPAEARAAPSAGAADGYEDATIDLVLPTSEARTTLQFDKVVLDEREGPVIFVTGVAIGSRAEAAGVVPGQRLVALSDPVNDGDLWFLDGTERLAFVQDAIRSTRQYECTIVLESEVTVTKEAVDAVRPPPREETRPEARAAPPRATPEQLGFARPPPAERREREDLYSDKWAGDEYVGDGFWNELTVGLAIFIAVPAVITAVATVGRGTLWDKPTF